MCQSLRLLLHFLRSLTSYHCPGHFSEGGINDVAERAFCSSVPAITRPRHHQDEQRGEGETSHGIREQPTCLARSRCGRCCSPATSSLSRSCSSVTHQPTHLPPEQQHGRAHQPCHAEPGRSTLPQTTSENYILTQATAMAQQQLAAANLIAHGLDPRLAR